MFRPGDTVGGYEIVSELRGGGMATLFLGKKAGPGGFARQVAIKVVQPQLAKDPTFVQMFLDEARISARIQHPNVVHIEGLGEARGCYYLIMEYVHGLSLGQVQKMLGTRKKRLSPRVVAWIAMAVADALHAAHELRGDDGRPLGVVHRDVSPQNVLVSQSGHVKLIDFGIAKAKGRLAQTSLGVVKGKIQYMAPEQARGAEVDRRTDVYALGLVIWEMLVGRRMYYGAAGPELFREVVNPNVQLPSQLTTGVPPALESVTMRALEPQVERRFQSAQELWSALAAAQPDAGSLAASELAQFMTYLMNELATPPAPGAAPVAPEPKIATELTVPSDQIYVESVDEIGNLTDVAREAYAWSPGPPPNQPVAFTPMRGQHGNAAVPGGWGQSPAPTAAAPHAVMGGEPRPSRAKMIQEGEWTGVKMDARASAPSPQRPSAPTRAERPQQPQTASIRSETHVMRSTGPGRAWLAVAAVAALVMAGLAGLVLLLVRPWESELIVPRTPALAQPALPRPILPPAPPTPTPPVMPTGAEPPALDPEPPPPVAPDPPPNRPPRKNRPTKNNNTGTGQVPFYDDVGL
jgi:serine/threonine protein kinase